MVDQVLEQVGWPVDANGRLVMKATTSASAGNAGSLAPGYIPVDSSGSAVINIVPDGDNKSFVIAEKNPVTGGIGLSGLRPLKESMILGVADIDYADAAEKPLSVALRLRGIKSTPTYVETAPAIASTGTNYYIDPVAGSNANNGTTPATPWADFWKLGQVNPGVGAVIHIAADAVFDYPQTLANYIALPLFPANFCNSMVGTAASPITIRPYHPRGSTASKPTIRWYATTTAADWVQETGISGGKVWSAAWAANKNYRTCGVLFGNDLRIGVAFGQQANPGQPSVLVGADQYTANNTKVYVFVPDGTNPVSYYGQIRLIGGRAAMQGYAGPAHLKILGLRFEQMWPMEFVSYASTNAPQAGIEIAYCEFSKCLGGVRVKNAATYSSPLETAFVAHDNYIENAFHTTFHIDSASGTAGNTVSWELYRNRICHANLSSADMGGLAYIQSAGGSKHIAWGNYGFDCRNGTGATQIDGSMLYADIYSSSVIFFGNVAEQCGKAFQSNCALNVHIVANLAIDCGCLAHLTNATPASTTPAGSVIHNTWLWTGRLASTAIPAGPNVGGTGVGSWDYQAVITQDNQQKGSNGNNFSLFACLNNAAINIGAKSVNKPFLSIYTNGITTATIAGNAAAGLADAAVFDKYASADLTKTASYMHELGAFTDGPAWVAEATSGVARPSPGSPLIGNGVPLSVQYQDIGGRNFGARPTIGCYEVNA